MEPSYDALPPTQPITLPMRDEFGEYFTDWVHEAKRKNSEILAN